MMEVKPFRLPEDFLMGAATAALQIEGGDENNNWYRWCEEGRIKDGTHCINANDHWNRYSKDISLMDDLNFDIYRMGLEWSRIEPVKGEFSEEGIKHYREEIQELLDKDITPLVTLHHFSHPLWLEDEGGWENTEVIKYFERYTSFVVEKLGDLVTDWITINEPNVFIYGGYLEGFWPPGKKSILSSFRVMKNMIKAHIKSYKVIHQQRKIKGYKGNTMVGVANHIRIFQYEKDNILDKLAANAHNYTFHKIIMEGMARGKLLFPLGTGNYPLGRGKFYDFIGINYYSRDIIRFVFNPSKLFTESRVKEGSEINDLGWEIYPEGIAQICRKYYNIYKAPIFITENGICDEKDEKRSRFIYHHLKQLSDVIAEGVPVKRYYYWTLLDNFEWIEGESARFGLIHNEYATQERTVRESGRFYGEICSKKEIDNEMIEEYIN
ncbi:MAG: glycoside hydrolase family 1 protein [bacterium]